MTIPLQVKNRNMKRNLFSLAFLLLGICIGLFAAWGFRWENNRPEPDVAETNFYPSEAGVPTTGTNADTDVTDSPEPKDTDQIVDYPFSDDQEGWKLILHEEITEDRSERLRREREFRLYNRDGELVQTFSCSLEAEKLIFQFDHLFHQYYHIEDLVVFPADADETGVKGLCYPWDYVTETFSDDPVVIPWYQETCCDSYNAFLTTETIGDTVTNTICRIVERSEQVVELRKWFMSRDERDGKEILRIWDCLSEQDLYWGEVERNVLGNLVNDKYYQYLFRHNLEELGSVATAPTTIETNKMIQGSSETLTYQNREEFLADCGFQNKEPFYEYYDPFHRLELELFFDEQTGQGCGIYYWNSYNDALEQNISCDGFAFDQVSWVKWMPEDIFSTQSVYGTDAKTDNISGYKETYEYTDDGKISSFKAMGTIMDYDYGKDTEIADSTLLSMDYVYRSDGTLYHKSYYHNWFLFGKADSPQSCYYDEQGRIVYRYAPTSEWKCFYYYIYKDDREKPAYCLMVRPGDGVYDLISY